MPAHISVRHPSRPDWFAPFAPESHPLRQRTRIFQIGRLDDPHRERPRNGRRADRAMRLAPA